MRKMLQLFSILMIIPFLTNSTVGNEGTSISRNLAHQYFQEIHRICTEDDGKLWGVQLYGPMLFVKPQTREVIANQQDKLQFLQPDSGVYSGILPDSIGIANTATDMSGTKWTMLMWPVPTTQFERNRLLIHELFHRIQQEIGIPMASPMNPQLDQKNGRILLRLEWEALLSALKNSGKARRYDLQSALIFRQYRHELFPNADSFEPPLELNEGLAEYTGVKLASHNEQEAIDYVSNQLKKAPQLPTLVRSFAYISGPLYGLNFDDTGKKWRKSISAKSDFGIILQELYHLKIPKDLKQAVQKREAQFNGKVITQFEDKRAQKRAEQIAEYHEQFVQKPVLILPLKRKNIQFDPRGVTPVDSLGTHYSLLKATEQWGSVLARQGALLSPDWSEVRLNATGLDTVTQNSPIIELNGWTLKLNPEWSIIRKHLSANYIVKEKDQ